MKGRLAAGEPAPQPPVLAVPPIAAPSRPRAVQLAFTVPCGQSDSNAVRVPVTFDVL